MNTIQLYLNKELIEECSFKTRYKFSFVEQHIDTDSLHTHNYEKMLKLHKKYLIHKAQCHSTLVEDLATFLSYMKHNIQDGVLSLLNVWDLTPGRVVNNFAVP